MKNSQIKEGDKFHIDTYRVSQYEETRIVDDVIVEETPAKNAKKVLVHSPYLMASVLVFIRDLKEL
jgi:endonuclease IV